MDSAVMWQPYGQTRRHTSSATIRCRCHPRGCICEVSSADPRVVDSSANKAALVWARVLCVWTVSMILLSCCHSPEVCKSHSSPMRILWTMILYVYGVTWIISLGLCCVWTKTTTALVQSEIETIGGIIFSICNVPWVFSLSLSH